MEIVQSASQESAMPQFDVREYLRILRKRIWIILAVFLVSVISVWTHNSKQQPIYKAVTRIVIDKERQNIVSVNEVLQVDQGNAEYQETQFQILKSRSMILRIIEELELYKSPEFNPSPAEIYQITIFDMGHWIMEGMVETAHIVKDAIIPPKPEPPPPLQDRQKTASEEKLDPELAKHDHLYGAVAERLSVTPVRGTRLVDLSFTGSNPSIIAQILNKLTNIYVEQNLQTRLYASEDASVWLDERLVAMQEKVEQSERDLQIYSKGLGVISLEDSQESVNRRVTELSMQVIEARRRRTEVETLYKNSQNPKLAESLPEVINNPLIQDINKELSALETRLTELRETYGQKHPKIIQVQAQIENVRKSIAEEIRKIHGSIYTQYQMALTSEQSLIEALEEQEQQASFLNEKSIRYGVLTREAATNRQMYDLLLKRLKETDLSLGLRTNNIRVIDPAVPPTSPFRPDKKRNMTMGILFGLVVGVVLAFVIEHLDNTVKEPDEIALRWGIPFLGLVGDHTVDQRRHAKSNTKIQLIACRDPSSNIAESLRTIRTNVIFSSDGDQQKSYMVTSALPGEGKTTIACNLAVVMASLGEKVLLVDGDMRRPSIHKQFNLDKSPGLSGYLIRQSEFDDILMNPGIDNLTIIPSGISPPNPSELLSHPQMKALVQKASERFDRIIIDTPPVASVTDPLIISREAQSVIIVMRCGVAPREAVTKSLQQLRAVNAKVMGAVLNAVDFRKDSYYYQYYYKHYYYRESEKPKPEEKVAV